MVKSPRRSPRLLLLKKSMVKPEVKKTIVKAEVKREGKVKLEAKREVKVEAGNPKDEPKEDEEQGFRILLCICVVRAFIRLFFVFVCFVVFALSYSAVQIVPWPSAHANKRKPTFFGHDRHSVLIVLFFV